MQSRDRKGLQFYNIKKSLGYALTINQNQTLIGIAQKTNHVPLSFVVPMNDIKIENFLE